MIESYLYGMAPITFVWNGTDYQLFQLFLFFLGYIPYMGRFLL